MTTLGFTDHRPPISGLRRLAIIAVSCAAPLLACTTPPEPLAYLGETRPSITPQVFAPGVVSLGDRHEFGSTFNRAGTELFFGVDLQGRAEIHWTKLVAGTSTSASHWSSPTALLSNPDFGFNDPILSPDEQQLYFISTKPREQEPPNDHDIWFAQRTLDGWSEPENVGAPINTNAEEYYISFLDDGSMVFASNLHDPERAGNFDIYLAPRAPGTGTGTGTASFQEPQPFPESINTRHYEADAFINADGSLLIFSTQRPGGQGRGDLFISFKQPNGDWSQAENLAPVNTSDHELCPFITADGRTLFYTSAQDIYWVDTAIFEPFRERATAAYSPGE